MPSLQRGIVISIHSFGASVRLADGTFAMLPLEEVTAHRGLLQESLVKKREVAFTIHRQGRRSIASVSKETSKPQLMDPMFEERMNAYLKSLEEREPPDKPNPAERRSMQKQKRAALFRAKLPGDERE